MNSLIPRVYYGLGQFNAGYSLVSGYTVTPVLTLYKTMPVTPLCLMYSDSSSVHIGSGDVSCLV